MMNKISTLILRRSLLSAAFVFGLFGLGGCGETGGGGADGLVTGTGGSTARMVVVGQYLYAISGRDVQLIDIAAPESPNPWTRVSIDWDIQTLFPYGDYLLVGAADGIHILDNTDPASPVHLADFQHATARDPVVAKDGYAYVTLKRDDSVPGGLVENQMNVIDISEINSPELLEVYSMQGPSGLAVADQQLFVCDGSAGLKIFDVDNPATPVVIGGLANIDCLDVIAQNNILYVITSAELLQYDYSVTPPVLLSRMSAPKAS